MARFGLRSVPKMKSVPKLRTGPGPIAMDFGVGALKVLQVENGNTHSLIAAASVETPEDLLYDPARRVAFQAKALPKLLKSGKFKGKRAVAALPAAQSVCKHLQIQKPEGVNVGELATAAIAQQLERDPSQIVSRHVEVEDVERSSTRCEVICFTAEFTLVEKLMQILRDSKVEPVGIHSEFHALVSAFGDLRGAEEQPGATLYLDIGVGTTLIVIAHGPKLVFARMVEIGGRHMDETISRQEHCTLTEARLKRHAMTSIGSRSAVGAGMAAMAAGMAQQGSADEPVEGPDLSEPVEILTDEIMMSLRYHGSLFPSTKVSRVVFVGGESRHTALCHHVAKMLRLPAQVGDPLARISRTGKEPVLGVDLSIPQPGWAVPLGLCLCPTDL